MELSYLTGTQAHFTLIVQCQVFSDKKIGAEQFLLCVFVAISFLKKKKKEEVLLCTRQSAAHFPKSRCHSLSN